jgi:hypothetical protein
VHTVATHYDRNTGTLKCSQCGHRVEVPRSVQASPLSLLLFTERFNATHAAKGHLVRKPQPPQVRMWHQPTLATFDFSAAVRAAMVR